jgi:hypothetical protein
VSTVTEETPAVACLICEAPNPPEAGICAHCSAPMAIIHDSVLQAREPRIISIIGDSNVGKTVYLGMLLDMLARRVGDFEAVPKGAYSVHLQQNVVGHLASRVFPPKTPMEADQWYWAYYQIAYRSRGHEWFDLIMPDMAGEALAAEIDAPKTHGVIRSLLHKCEGAILLVDAAVAAQGSAGPDFFALKLLSYMDNVFAVKRQERVKTPVAVVLCKADCCPAAFDDPRVFAETNLNRLWNICDSRFANVEFFAASSVGSLGYVAHNPQHIVSVPLHAAPRGIVEPFEWILAQL